MLILDAPTDPGTAGECYSSRVAGYRRWTAILNESSIGTRSHATISDTTRSNDDAYMAKRRTNEDGNGA